MSNMFQTEKVDRSGKLMGGFVFLISFVVYLITVQQTFSLWDCSEFIACSYTLGVAHPPGTPLFLLIGRVFSLLPTGSDIAFRVNLLSVLSGAAAATFAYFVAIRLIFFLPGVAQSHSRRLTAYICSASGALLFAFSRTNWLNSVEAEVYSLSMMLIFFLIWLSLKWYDARGKESAPRYLILIAYTATLSVGIHMTVFLVMPAIFAFLVIADRRLLTDLRFWLSSILLFSITMNFNYFLFGLTAWLVIALLAYMSNRSRQWLLAVYIAIAGLVGFSTHTYIPIRASYQPYINQNNPQTWKKLNRYIGRKQYGERSMVEKMFERRAYWSNQFGDFPRMGFGGFLVHQYGMSGVFFLIPALLVMIAIIALIKWKWKIGLYIALILFSFTAGLVLYMNFADGSAIDPVTGNDKLEVRDRDYFFTPGFILFGLLIGVGAFVVIDRVVASAGRENSANVGIVLGFLSLAMPLSAVIANYNEANRSDNYLPYDYAYNILNSCPENAILFTNGDNDTFPVWCLQEVYGVRRDVKVVNLSLIQTDWYQLQMKYQLDVPISFEDEQMIWQDYYDDRIGMIIQRPVKPYADPLRGGWVHYLQAYQEPETGELVSTAHFMIENIIAANKWKFPVCFVNGFPSQVKYPLAKHMQRRGVVHHLVREESQGRFDNEETIRLLRDVYRFTNLDDPKLYRDPIGTALIIGTCQPLLEFVQQLAADGDTTRALEALDLLIEKIPEYWQLYDLKIKYANLDQIQAAQLWGEYENYVDRLIAHNPDNAYYYQYRGIMKQLTGRIEEAVVAVEQAYEVNRAISNTYMSVLTAYMQTGRHQEAVRISKEFLKTNPHDQTAKVVAAGRGFPTQPPGR